jgi:hypothetical protein
MFLSNKNKLTQQAHITTGIPANRHPCNKFTKQQFNAIIGSHNHRYSSKQASIQQVYKATSLRNRLTQPQVFQQTGIHTTSLHSNNITQHAHITTGIPANRLHTTSLHSNKLTQHAHITTTGIPANRHPCNKFSTTSSSNRSPTESFLDNRSLIHILYMYQQKMAYSKQCRCISALYPNKRCFKSRFF